MINVIIIIHICNKYYEYTGNQYILTDNDHLNEFCDLYPSTLQGKMINTSIESVLFLFLFLK